jgi:hypothetical protein
MHTRGTRRIFLKMEPHRSLEKLSVMPMQHNCCMGCLRGWWIHPMWCALDCPWTVYPLKAWMDCLRRGMGSSDLVQPPPLSPNRRCSSSTSGILWHLFDPILVLEKCFWGGYFIICWYTLIVTLTYLEKCLCYCICNFIVRSLLS